MTTETIDRAREAFGRQAWSEVFGHLSAPGAGASLDFADLERLAIAAYMLGRANDAFDAGERAYHQAIREGDIAGAARAGFWLGFGLVERGEQARGGGWLARAGRLLEEDGEPRVEQGYLLIPAAIGSMADGDIPGAYATFEAIAAIAERFSDLDLVTLGQLGRGECLIGMGQRRAGIALLDEAMLAVTAGEVSPMIVGIVYCSAVEVIQQVFDLRRAQEWTAALTRWCDSQPDAVPYRGRCLVYRTELMVLHGAWHEAVDEAQRARDWLAGPPVEPAIGEALYQQAELHRLRGSFAAAESAYRQGAEHGRRPEPGLALLRLAQGRPEVAAAAIRRALDEAQDAMSRSRLLAPSVEIMIAAGDLEAARASADELLAMSADAGTPLLQALASNADGCVRLAQGDARAALVALRRSWEAWRELGAPYEAARVRVLIGHACRALGDEDTAGIELDAARAVFQELGAEPDLVRLDGPSRSSHRTSFAGLSDREIEVLRQIVEGKTNCAIAAQLGISERTVDRHVSNIFAKLGVSTRAAATAFAYEHDLL